MKERFTLRPKEHSVLVKQTSKWGQAIAVSLMSLGGMIILTSYLYKIDEIITVPGILTPAEGGVEIKSPISGKIKYVNVKEGEIVNKNDVLIKYDVEKQLEEKSRIEKELILEKQNQTEKLRSNELKIINKKSSLRLTNELFERLRPLREAGALSEIKLLQQQERIKSIENEILMLESERDNIKTLSEAKINENKSKLRQVELILKESEIRTPIKGEVFNVKAGRRSYIATKAEILMEIIPQEELSASLKVGNKDIGFMRIGQDVKVRVDSYPFTEYGELKGKIEKIGADALEPDRVENKYHFPVNIKLATSELLTKSNNKIPLQAGMTVSANIKLRERRLIEIISDMFVSQQESIERLRKP